MSLTLREVVEQLTALDVLAEIRLEAMQRSRKWDEEWREPEVVEVKEGDEGKKVADSPHLTGDPEFDAIELQETDPAKSPLKLATIPRSRG